MHPASKVGPRSSWLSSATSNPGYEARARVCPSRLVACRQGVALASVAVAPVRPNSKPTGDGSPAGYTSWRPTRSRASQVAIVGYTNAGKSTLLNRLSGAGVLVEDRLFATLDATTRRLQLPGGEAVLLSDTVGFVRKLPHQLVESFRSTLRVAAEADLLVHVVDGAGPDPMGHIRAVREVLAEIGAGDVAELLCFNKSDRSDEVARLVDRNPGSVGISAYTGEGVEQLLVAVAERLRATTTEVDLLIPFDRGDLIAEAHREGEVLAEEAVEGGMALTARLDDAAAARLAPWVVA